MCRHSYIFRYTCAWLCGMVFRHAFAFQHHQKGFNFPLIPWYLWYLSPPAKSENIIYTSLSPLCQAACLERLSERCIKRVGNSMDLASPVSSCYFVSRITLPWVRVHVGRSSPRWLAAYHILFIFDHLEVFQCYDCAAVTKWTIHLCFGRLSGENQDYQTPVTSHYSLQTVTHGEEHNK